MNKEKIQEVIDMLTEIRFANSSAEVDEEWADARLTKAIMILHALLLE